MYSEVPWVLVSSGNQQVQPQIILDLDYTSDYLSVSYDYVVNIYSLKKQLPSTYLQGNIYFPVILS